MNQIPAIKTKYSNITFRSKLEARWAKYWDEVGVSWIYEPKRIDLHYKGNYLPDFKIFDKYFVEIKHKGNYSDKELTRMMSRICELSFKPITTLLFFGDPLEYREVKIWFDGRQFCPRYVNFDINKETIYPSTRHTHIQEGEIACEFEFEKSAIFGKEKNIMMVPEVTLNEGDKNISENTRENTLYLFNYFKDNQEFLSEDDCRLVNEFYERFESWTTLTNPQFSLLARKYQIAYNLKNEGPFLNRKGPAA